MKRAVESTLGAPANRVETDIKYGYLRRRIKNSDKVLSHWSIISQNILFKSIIFFGKEILFFPHSELRHYINELPFHLPSFRAFFNFF